MTGESLTHIILDGMIFENPIGCLIGIAIIIYTVLWPDKEGEE